jgi:hypothetical protein
MKMKIFHFDKSYITRRRKRFINPNARCPKISLLQTQRNPQSNAKQEIKTFYFKDTLKEIASFFKTKATQTTIFLLK